MSYLITCTPQVPWRRVQPGAKYLTAREILRADPFDSLIVSRDSTGGDHTDPG